MEKAIELAGNIIDKLKVKEIIVALLIAGTFILYASDNILSTLGLEIWRDKYRSHIGAAVLLSFVLCLIWIVIFIKGTILKSTLPFVIKTRKYLKKSFQQKNKNI